MLASKTPLAFAAMLCVVSLGLLPSAASATVIEELPAQHPNDLYAPSWRGQEGTTVAVWEFLGPSPTPDAEMEDNPYGSSSFTVVPLAGQDYQQDWGGRIGVWP
ncbi:MAG: hypothetical protein J7M21_00920, partial [Planctomycetes bacterium]|nr:hypothetical protein [Planctomycetota bacterium]